MKAITQDRFCTPDLLELREVDQPVPADDEVLVRVRAASVHKGDWHYTTGVPYVMSRAAALPEIKLSVIEISAASMVVMSNASSPIPPPLPVSARLPLMVLA